MIDSKYCQGEGVNTKHPLEDFRYMVENMSEQLRNCFIFTKTDIKIVAQG
jgi:hypothetical protein